MLKDGSRVCLVIGLLSCHLAMAHPDLDVQIQALSARIETSPADAGLYLKRGDLYRRHEDWGRAVQDFGTARRIEPGHAQIDWLEGRFRVDAGEWRKGAALLSRFLAEYPDHTGALQVRAAARWRLGDPRASAADFARAIEYSERPSPSLYRSLVIAQYASAEGVPDVALETVDAGLQRFPGEVALLGLGVDLALAKDEALRARRYLAMLPDRLDKLPQWIFRSALLACQEGEDALARHALLQLTGDDGQNAAKRAATWTLPAEIVSGILSETDADTCRRAAMEVLGRQQP